MKAHAKKLAVLSLILLSCLTVLASSGWTPQGNSESQEVYRAHILSGGTYNWYGNTSALASLAANWAPATGPPGAGDNIVFGATATACTLDSALTYGSMTMGTGSPTVTLGANIGVTSFSMSAGTFTGSSSYTMTDSGSWTKTGGALTDFRLRLIMTGTGSTISTNAYIDVRSLQISANVSLSGSLEAVSTGTTIDAGKTFTLNAGAIYAQDISLTWSNLGAISGAGSFKFYGKSADATRTLGAINCPILIFADSGSTASRTLTVGASTIFGSTVNVYSNHASNTMTLDLSTSNYALSATDITIGTRGILNGRGSAITCSGSWDSSAGTFTRGTSTVTLTGTTKTLKTQTTLPGFNNLGISGTYTLQSNIWAKNLTLSGTVTQATYRMNATQSLSALGSWNGNIYLNGTASSYDVMTTVPWNGYIFAQVPTRFFNGSSSLQVCPPTSMYSQVKITKLKYNAEGPASSIQFQCTQASGTTNFTALGLDGYAYQIFVGGVFYSNLAADGFGYYTWGYTGWSTRYFNITGTPTPFNTNEITTTSILTLILGLSFVFVFLFVGLKNPWFLMVDGVLWIAVALSIFIDYGDIFTYSSLGVGIFAMVIGGYRIAD